MRKAIRELHKSLKKTHPHIVREAAKPFKYKYPKLTLLGISILITYLIFRHPAVSSFFLGLGDLRYLGIFIAGMLFAYGFTTPFAIGLFLISDPQNMLLAVIVGTTGSFVSDYIIFKFIKNSFMDEFNQIENTKSMKKFSHAMNRNLNKKIKLYLLYAFAGLILASPAPDELGVALLTGLGHIKETMLAILSISTKAVAIYLILLI